MRGQTVSDWVRESLAKVCRGDYNVWYHEREMLRGNLGDRDRIAVSLQFRIHDSELVEWIGQAQCQGLEIGEWIRQSLDYVERAQGILRSNVV